MSSAHLSRLAARNGSFSLSCRLCSANHRRLNDHAMTMTAADALARWGDITLEEVRFRARCKVCGYRGPEISIECWTPNDAKMGIG